MLIRRKLFELNYSSLEFTPPQLGEDFGLNSKLIETIERSVQDARYFEASIFECRNVFVWGDWGYLVNEDGTPDNSLMKLSGWGDEHILAYESQEIPSKVIKIESNIINLLWPGVSTYGHWLLDTAARIMLVKESGIDLTECVVLIPAGAPSYMHDIISCFGLEKSCEMEPEHAIICDRLIHPTHTRSSLVFPLELYDKTFEIFRSFALRAQTDAPTVTSRALKIYSQHTPMSSVENDPRLLANEYDVWNIFSSLGFIRINPLEFSFAGQASLFHSASMVAGIDSSALHNALFSPQGLLKELIVLSPPWRVNYNHILVCALTRSRLTMINGLGSNVKGSFLISTEGLRAGLLREKTSGHASTVAGSQIRETQMNRDEVINYAISSMRYANYLEIGVEKGSTFNLVRAAKKVAVDPVFRIDRSMLSGQSFAMTSDQFFDDNPDVVFDLIFVDGLHIFEQALRDILRAERRLSVGGMILVDDCYPSDEMAAHRSHDECVKLKAQAGHADRNWMGDTYKSILFINDFCDSLNYAMIKDTMGVVAIWRESRRVTPFFGDLMTLSSCSYDNFVSDLALRLPRRSLGEIVESVKSASREA